MKNSYGRMTCTFQREADTLLTIRTADGKKIETTPTHPFFVEGRGFVAAKRLARSDLLTDREGWAAAVVSVTERKGRFPVYNLEVAGAGTYYAGEAGWWVHNTCEWHHMLPQAEEFTKYWDRAKIDIHNYTSRIDADFHQNWLHGGPLRGNGGWWNDDWRQFFKQNPNADKDEILSHMNEMRQFWAIDNVPIHRYPFADMFGK